MRSNLTDQEVDEGYEAVILIGEGSYLDKSRSLSCSKYTTIKVPKYHVINGISYPQDSKDVDGRYIGSASGIFDYDTMRSIEGRMCGIVDALFGEKKQRESLKNLVRREIWDMYHDHRRLFEYEYAHVTKQ
jgi:hypothetical protein